VALALFVAAARFCVRLVADIEAASGRPLTTIDIGGGLSTSFTEPVEPENCSFALYRFFSQCYACSWLVN
jgi:diaminopimelate decarboxylase